MFLSILVQNFRSLKDESIVNFSAVDSKNHMPNHVFTPKDGAIGALRSAGLYGANASGKTNVLLAFEALRYMIVRAGSLKDGEKIPCYEPYMLSNENKIQPIKFEVDFFIKDTRYIYKISFTKDKIISESLDFYPSRAKANIFTRSENDTWETIKFGGMYKGGTKKFAFFDNNPYLSKAGDNASSPKIIRDVYNFFYKDILFVSLNDKMVMRDKEKSLKKISEIMRYIDTGINAITFKKIEQTFDFQFPDDIPSDIKEMIIEDNTTKFEFHHENEDGGFEVFPESLESDGTKKLFELMPLFMAAFSEQKIVIVDELDNNIHPHLADLIIRLFNDSYVNRFGSQLIFSTHNMQLMSPDKMRRDQILFAEKNKGKTIVYSLDDFDKSKVKTSTPYAQWYDEGRFGAVPKLNYKKISELLSGERKVDKTEFEMLFGSDEEN